MIIKRKFPAVLRFNKTNRDKNPKKFMLGELMLYRPTNKEIELDEVNFLYEEMHGGKRKIQIVKSKVMEQWSTFKELKRQCTMWDKPGRS